MIDPLSSGAGFRPDRTLLQAAGALRAVGTSLAGVLLGLDLAELGHDAAAIGAALRRVDDPLLFLAFRDVRPPEELARG